MIDCQYALFKSIFSKISHLTPCKVPHEWFLLLLRVLVADWLDNIFPTSKCRYIPYGENRGAAHFAAHGLRVGNRVGCPWAAHGNFAMQIRLPTTSIYGNSGQLSRQPTASKIWIKWAAQWAAEWAANGLPMGILPCKLGCPLLPYKETVGSSVGSELLPNLKKWAAQWAVEWAAHGNFDMQIRLSTNYIYGGSGQLSGQLSGQPTTFEYGNCGQFSGQPTDLCTIKFKMEAIFDSHAKHL